MSPTLSPDTRAISIFAPAKINLYLHVVGRRDDGYHLLDSLVVFAAPDTTGAISGTAGDTLTVAPADQLTLAIDGPFADGLPTDRGNLVLKAADALAAALPAAEGAGRGAKITLTKRLPPASGIGGGSADAAATLRALLRLWQAQLPATELAALALRLGADLPMCLESRAAFVGGIGEVIDPLPSLPRCWLVLVNPGVAVATPQVFRARTGPVSPPGRFAAPPADAAQFASLLAHCSNDLAPPAIRLCPVIGEVLAALAGCDGALLSRMSGSGATCFALFADAALASAAAARIAADHPDWWVTATRIAGEQDSV